MMQVRTYLDEDRAEWLRMREALWPEIGASVADADRWLGQSRTCVLVVCRVGAEGLAGFAEVGSRSYADGCDTSPVAYLEAWYVDPDVRRRGFGTALLRAAEEWSRAQGFQELASDALLENFEAQRAHLFAGFEEVERSVKYCKRL